MTMHGHSAGLTRVGDRVVLERCGDRYSSIMPGTEGTVDFVDDVGTVHVTWDDGRRLGLIAGEDRWRVLPTVES
jgi:hypothetical protein